MKKFLFMAVLEVVGTWAEERVKDRDSILWLCLTFFRERYAEVAIQNWEGRLLHSHRERYPEVAVRTRDT